MIDIFCLCVEVLDWNYNNISNLRSSYETQPTNNSNVVALIQTLDNWTYLGTTWKVD